MCQAAPRGSHRRRTASPQDGIAAKADLDAEEVGTSVGAFVEPVQGAAVLVAKVRRHPDHDGRLDARGVDRQLPKVAVVGAGRWFSKTTVRPSSVSAWMSR